MESILNLVIITLLVVAIIYGMILNHRLNAFKESKKDILKAVNSFNQVIKNAQTTLGQIQKGTDNLSEQLKSEMNKANLLRDDLVLILDKAAKNKIYEEMSKEKRTSFSAPVEIPSPVLNEKRTSFAKENRLYQSEAEKELLQALKQLREET